jgi:hypothetical protein
VLFAFEELEDEIKVSFEEGNDNDDIDELEVAMSFDDEAVCWSVAEGDNFSVDGEGMTTCGGEREALFSALISRSNFCFLVGGSNVTYLSSDCSLDRILFCRSFDVILLLLLLLLLLLFKWLLFFFFVCLSLSFLEEFRLMFESTKLVSGYFGDDSTLLFGKDCCSRLLVKRRFGSNSRGWEGTLGCGGSTTRG